MCRGLGVAYREARLAMEAGMTAAAGEDWVAEGRDVVVFVPLDLCVYAQVQNDS